MSRCGCPDIEAQAATATIVASTNKTIERRIISIVSSSTVALLDHLIRAQQQRWRKNAAHRTAPCRQARTRAISRTALPSWFARRIVALRDPSVDERMPDLGRLER